MSRGSVVQRHRRSCPRGPDGSYAPHRCKGPWAYSLETGRRPDGSRRQVTRSGFATRREAQEALSVAVERARSGIADTRPASVGAFLDEWLDTKRRLRDTTRRNYESHIRLYLRPALGSLRLPDLAPHHVDHLYGDMLDGHYRGATAATVHHVHRTLRSALNTAVKRRLIGWNPALHVELPERTRRETTVWGPEEVGRFLDAIADDRLYALFHLIAFTGMRRGEALGLHWADVHLAGPHISVRWQVVDAGRGPQLGLPKTRAGTRVVPLDAATAEVLEDHRLAQDAERTAWGEAWQDGGLVFTREDGRVLRPDQVSLAFSRLVRASGLPRIRLHDLRHTHASLALAAGVDIKVVSDRLGHSTTLITRDLYTHVIPALARSAAGSIAATVPRAAKIPSAPLAHPPSEEGARAPPRGGTAGQG